MNSYLRRIYHQGVMIHLEIIRTRRKSLAIHVFPQDKITEVRVPLKCPWVEIEAFIDARLDWIVESMERLQDVPPEPKFVPGSRHYFLGAPYELVIKKGVSKVVKEGGSLIVTCPQPTSEAYVERVFYNHLKKACLPIFEERLESCLADFPSDEAPIGLRVRRMKARWGSCSEKGEICLNTLLVQKSTEVIDLVITHELCHLVHFHHNRAFYNLLTRAMPDWKEREASLAKNIPDIDQDASLPVAGEPLQLSLL